MQTNLSKYKDDLDLLVKQGQDILLDLSGRVHDKNGTFSKKNKELFEASFKGKFEEEYQSWYSESREFIRQILPFRLEEFEHLYKGNGKRKSLSAETFCIQDWMNGIRAPIENIVTKVKCFDDYAAVFMRFQTQFKILQSTAPRFESTLFDIKTLVQADLFDSELEAARELLKNKYVRGAGAIAGVVLEKHLEQVSTNHQLSSRKRNPTISDFNDLLKSENVIDTPKWRSIQYLGDIRNLCDHNKEREPSMEEVGELINGVEKLTKTLF